jgi:hypothetical protein
VLAVEIGARRQREARGREQLGAERARIAPEMADVGVEVERAVERGEAGKAGRSQQFQQARAVAPVDLDLRVQLGAAGEGRKRRLLRQRRGRDEQVLGEQLDRPDQVGRRDQPAQPPAGHAVVFREVVDHDRVAVVRQHAGRRRPVGDAVVDLVGDQADAALPAEPGDRRELVRLQHRAGRV